MKKIKTFALFMLLALCVTIPAAVASADEVAATSIVGHNLALEDNIEIVYIVEETAPQGAETGVLFWLSPQEEYVYGEQEYKITTPFGTVVNPNTGNTCQKYAFNYLSAKQMTENVYAVSFIKDGENITYSGVDKYSILQYAYNKKNSETILDGGTASLGEMLSAMLDYGAITQQYFGYNTERLANATYYSVSVSGGVLSDGLNYGLYKDGETVTVIAGEPETGKQFKQWVDENNNVLGTATTLSLSASEDITVSAEYLSETQGLAYTLNYDGNSYTVAGIGSTNDTDIVIPSIYNGLPVTRIEANAFYNCNTLTSIMIPNSITNIGMQAFLNCSSLTNIKMSNCITSIGTKAFEYCDLLTNITIPNSIITLEAYTFRSCNSLTSITFCENSQLTSIRNCAFSNCSNLTSITIPEGVTSIGDRAFDGCSSLASITFCENSQLTSIGNNAFSDCSSLTSIIIPDNVLNIENHTFFRCSNLTRATIGTAVTSIGNNAFSWCSRLTSIKFGKNSQLSSIGDYAFSNCSILTSINTPDSVTSIGKDAFFGCSSLTIITIPNNVTSIGDYAFSSCRGLYVIENHSDLSLTIGATDNGNLAQNAKIIINKDNSKSYKEDGSQYILTDDNFLFKLTGNNYYLIAYVGGNETVTVPSDINGNAYTVNSMRGVINVVVPNGVTSIGSNAFGSCSSLMSIAIPDSVTSIGFQAFYGCSSLTSITFNGTTAQWNAISKGANWKNNVPATVVHCSNGDVAI